jgi:hypothetical protein
LHTKLGAKIGAKIGAKSVTSIGLNLKKSLTKILPPPKFYFINTATLGGHKNRIFEKKN